MKSPKVVLGTLLLLLTANWFARRSFIFSLLIICPPKESEPFPNEEKQMPLVFVVDPALPDDIETVTLSYTFFDVNSRIN